MNADLIKTVIEYNFKNCGVDPKDLFQEGYLALMKAEQTFNPDAGVKFETYATKVIKNRLIDVVREHSSSERELSDVQALVWGIEEPETPPELHVILQILEQIYADCCNELERAVFDDFLQGYSYEEIAQRQSVNKKKVDNTVQKIRKLVKSCYYEN